MKEKNKAEKIRKRVYEVINGAEVYDRLSRGYDVVSTLILLTNLVVSVMYTFEGPRNGYGGVLVTVEAVTVAAFAVDYVLRVWTAGYARPRMTGPKAILKYVFSFTGIVDLLSFLPYYLPFFFPSGAAVFRMFRVMRVFRLFRINAYYDSLAVITEVIRSKSQQLMSSVFIILILMLASSLCMYSLEHEAQPEVFSNAFSGIWWSVSTLLTIGYGDIYPITPMGQVFSIIITFLGVGMVAIPTGIISAGFVDQYSRIKRMSEYAREEDVQFIKLQLAPKDKWVGLAIKDIGLPHGVLVAAIQRRGKVIVPRGDVVLKSEDTLVLGAESFADDKRIDLKEVLLKKHHPWNGQRIRELDISRQTIIITVKRRNKALIPNGDMVLQEGDRVLLYSQQYISHAGHVEI